MGRKKKHDVVQAPIKNSFPGGPGVGGGINPIGFPGNQGTGWSTQISQPTTEFINLRWYLVSNMRQFLSEMYVEIGLVQTIVDVPVDDALRGGVEIKSKQLDEEQIEELTNSLDRNDDLNTIGQAAKWNRLFGGAGILILTDQDPEEPLDLKNIKEDTPLEFRAVDMWELFWDKQNSEGYDPAIQSEDFEYYNYYGEIVHKSRVMRLKGMSAPSFIRPKLRGWGYSVTETLVRSLNQYLKGTSLIFEVLDEFKVDVYKIKNLVNTLMSPQGEESVKRRIALANYQKNYQGALVMDSEDDWDHKQLSFAGLAETMDGIRKQVASDMRMPLTKLFGQSAAGFSSGEDDIEVYNSMVESQVRNKIKYDILRVCEIKCQKMFGFVPDDLSVSFKPLRVLSAEQEENVKDKKFQRLWSVFQAGQMSQEDFRSACNKGNIFDITLDTSADEDFGGYMADTIQEGFNKPYNPQDIDNPGADRLDTRKSRATEVGGAGQEPPAPKSGGDPRNIAQTTTKTKNWDEAKHPRADDGKFGEGGGGKSKDAASKKKKGKPTETEAKAIRFYSGSLSSQFIAADRGEKVDEMVQEKNNILNKYLEKAPKFEGTIYRGLVVEKSEIKSFLSKYQPGETIERATKESWSKDHSAIKDRLISVARDKKEPVKIFFEFPDSDIGVDISQESRFEEEKEVLTPPKAKFKINKIEKQGDSYKIIFEKSSYTKNSSGFDKASYEADGGDNWIDPRRKYFFENPENVDQGLWARAKAACKDALGEERWQFIVWWFEKHGGKFH